MKNKIIKTIFIVLTLTIALKECFASSNISINYVSTGTLGNSYDKDGDGVPTYTSSWSGENNISFSCQVDYKITVTGGDIVYGYNQQNEEIMVTSGDTTKTSEDILAGTAVGLKITETRTIAWEITNVELTKTQTKPGKKVCSKPSVCNDRYVTINSISWLKIPFLLIVNKDCGATSCPASQEGIDGCTCTTGQSQTIPLTPSEDEIEKCRSDAISNQISSHASSFGSSNYTLKIRDSNDAKKNGIIKELNGKGGCSGGNPNYCSWTYAPDNVCLNLKTSKISYPDSGCGSGEIKIDNHNGHWHYFTPLNTKENDAISLTMSYKSQKEKQEGEFCKQVIESNPHNYQIFIRDSENNKLPSNIDRAKQIVLARGCYFGNEIKIETTQKFYNEQSDGTLKGFNFYYKPIQTNLSTLDDIEKKVFPNGISDNSIWKDWYDNTSKDKVVAPNLTNENITYVAEVSNNINKIRNYNKTYPYITWENMITTGASNFITNNTDIFTTQDDNYYKLGCGPANDNTTDHLYQRWCGTE